MMIPDPIQLLEDPPELTEDQLDAMEAQTRRRRCPPTFPADPDDQVGLLRFRNWLWHVVHNPEVFTQ